MPFQQDYQGYPLPYGSQQYGQGYRQLPQATKYQQQYQFSPQDSPQSAPNLRTQCQDMMFYQQPNFVRQPGADSSMYRPPPPQTQTYASNQNNQALPQASYQCPVQSHPPQHSPQFPHRQPGTSPVLYQYISPPVLQQQGCPQPQRQPPSGHGDHPNHQHLQKAPRPSKRSGMYLEQLRKAQHRPPLENQQQPRRVDPPRPSPHQSPHYQPQQNPLPQPQASARPALKTPLQRQQQSLPVDHPHSTAHRAPQYQPQQHPLPQQQQASARPPLEPPLQCQQQELPKDHHRPTAHQSPQYQSQQNPPPQANAQPPQQVEAYPDQSQHARHCLPESSDLDRTPAQPIVKHQTPQVPAASTRAEAQVSPHSQRPSSQMSQSRGQPLQNLPLERPQVQSLLSQSAGKQSSAAHSNKRPSHATPQKPPPRHPIPAETRSNQRVVSHVQVPIMSASQPQPQQRQPKNIESPADPAHGSVQLLTHEAQQARANMASSPLTEFTSSQVAAIRAPADVDYQAVLLALADEYISAAHTLSTPIAHHGSDDDLAQYHDLISTGLGCMETVLNNWRQQDPRKEARLRLRLASLLSEETENETEAEEVLSKGLALCERARLHDLKYSMHHLLARVLVKSNAKAALKALDKIVPEVEALQHWHWVYAFRFLRVSLSLQMIGHSETPAILKHLQAIAELADANRHVAILVTSATLETIVHLRSAAPDAVELAQRSLATARSHQLNPDMQRLPQVLALLDCLDLACSLQDFSSDRVAAKLKTMQNDLDTETKKDGWNGNGTYLVPIDLNLSDHLEGDTAGIWRLSKDGRPALVLQWLPRNDTYSLGYLLSGHASVHKNCIDLKAERYLTEGLKMINIRAETVGQSLSAAMARYDQQRSMRLSLQFNVVFALCGRADWVEATEHLASIEEELRECLDEQHEGLKSMLMYLQGVCKQALGESDEAFELFEAEELALPETPNKTPVARIQLCILAMLNKIMILCGSPERKPETDRLLAAVEPHCLSHQSKAMLSAYHFLRATSNREKLGRNNDSSIIKIKQSLQSALTAAKQAANQQLLSTIMNVMTSMYFTNIVGEQAEKSARVGRALAVKTQDKLWMAVANSMLGDTLERCGNLVEATERKSEAIKLVQTLPETLKRSLQDMEDEQ